MRKFDNMSLCLIVVNVAYLFLILFTASMCRWRCNFFSCLSANRGLEKWLLHNFDHVKHSLSTLKAIYLVLSFELNLTKKCRFSSKRCKHGSFPMLLKLCVVFLQGKVLEVYMLYYIFISHFICLYFLYVDALYLKVSFGFHLVWTLDFSFPFSHVGIYIVVEDWLVEFVSLLIIWKWQWKT